jgi:hypothetical protein
VGALPITLAVAVALVAGCGGSETGQPPRGAPTEPPPRVPSDGPSAPPPAWVETDGGAHWLAYGSYCWDDGCVDYVEPWRREDVPQIAVRRGKVVRFHLPFEPSELVVDVFERRGRDPRSVRLEPKRVVAWRVNRPGYVSVAAWRRHGDASYVARFVFG